MNCFASLSGIGWPAALTIVAICGAAAYTVVGVVKAFMDAL